MPADAQRETFQSLLGEALAEHCSYDVVQSVHDQLCGMIEENKANKDDEPLLVSKRAVQQLLEDCGVEEERVKAFSERYDAEFGEDAGLSPQNLVNGKQFELHTPDVTIRVNPERSELIETRVIDGVKYILIRADEGVEVNGMGIHIS